MHMFDIPSAYNTLSSMKVIANMAVLCFHSECGLSVLVAALMCFFEMGPSPLNHFFGLFVSFSGFIFFSICCREHICWTTQRSWKGHQADCKPVTR